MLPHEGHVHINMNSDAAAAIAATGRPVDLDEPTGQRPLEQVPIGQLLHYAGHQEQPDHDPDCMECSDLVRDLIRLLVRLGYVTLRSVHLAAGETLSTVDETHAFTDAPPVGDVLDAVDDEGRMRCACGCGRVITDRSPSAYYATPECQQTWMQRQARNPEQVYQRPDAHESIHADVVEAQRQYELDNPHARRPDRNMFEVPPRALQVPADAPAVAWLQTLSDEVTRRAEITFSADIERVRVKIPPTPQHRWAEWDYTRRCRMCGEDAPPRTYSGPAHPGELVALPPTPGAQRVFQECGRCQLVLPGRCYFGTLHLHAGEHVTLGFRLEDGLSRAAYELDTRLRASDIPAHESRSDDLSIATRRIWSRLEARLDKFADEWRTAANRDMDEPTRPPYMIDVPTQPRRRRRPWTIR